MSMVVALVGWGCRSTSGLSPEAQKIKAATYEYVYTTDSRIPQKVRRGSAPSQNSGASPVAILEGEEAKALLRKSRP
jgi:hypothetical protein